MENKDLVNAPKKTGNLSTVWQPGQSGNPHGRKAGSRNKASLLAEALLDGEAEKLVRGVIDMALKGDVAAARLCLERILPPVRERPCAFKLPKIETLNDASNALAMIIAGVTTGELLPGEAESLAGLVRCFMQSVEMAEFEARLVALEKASAPMARFDA